MALGKTSAVNLCTGPWLWRCVLCFEIYKFQDRYCSACNVRRVALSHLFLSDQTHTPNELKPFVEETCPQLRDFDRGENSFLRFNYKDPDLMVLQLPNGSLTFFRGTGLVYSLDPLRMRLLLTHVLLVDEAETRGPGRPRTPQEPPVQVVPTPPAEPKALVEDLLRQAHKLMGNSSGGAEKMVFATTHPPPPGEPSKRMRAALFADVFNDEVQQSLPEIMPSKPKLPRGVSKPPPRVSALQPRSSPKPRESELICFCCLRCFETLEEKRFHDQLSSRHKQLLAQLTRPTETATPTGD